MELHPPLNNARGTARGPTAFAVLSTTLAGSQTVALICAAAALIFLTAVNTSLSCRKLSAGSSGLNGSSSDGRSTPVCVYTRSMVETASLIMLARRRRVEMDSMIG